LAAMITPKMKLAIITIVLLFNLNFAFAQFYIDAKMDTISYSALPSNDRFMEHYVFHSNYKFYYDTIHRISIEIPDSFDIQKTYNKDFVIFELPKNDQILINAYSKLKFQSLSDLEFKELTKYKPGDTLKDYDKATLHRISLQSENIYKVEFFSYGMSFVQQWRFFENNFGYFAVVLFATENTYALRLDLFNKFITKNIKNL
jgi:hypothetical protein